MAEKALHPLLKIYQRPVMALIINLHYHPGLDVVEEFFFCSAND
jgi:hypothetical protein